MEKGRWSKRLNGDLDRRSENPSAHIMRRPRRKREKGRNDRESTKIIIRKLKSPDSAKYMQLKEYDILSVRELPRIRAKDDVCIRASSLAACAEITAREAFAA